MVSLGARSETTTQSDILFRRQQPQNSGALDDRNQILTNSVANNALAAVLAEDTFEMENSNQEARITQMLVSQTEKMKRALVEFDERHETLIDYFAIVGFDNGQMRKLIKELLDR